MEPTRSMALLGRRGFLKASAASLWLAGQGADLSAVEPTEIVVPLDQRLQTLVEQAPLSMQFRGATPEEARAWQTQFATKLRELLGPHRPPDKWDSVLERRVELADHVREERVLTAPGVAPVPFHLLLPGKGQPSAKLAGILALHGHGQFGHDAVAGIDDSPQRQANIASSQYDYGRKLVQRGYVVAAPCLTPFGRRLGEAAAAKRGDVCTLKNLQLQYLGKLLMAENLRDILWTLEFLAGHQAVDAQRLGCVGLSYGGRMTTLTAALEPRIRVAVIAGALNCLQERAQNAKISGCQLIPGLLEYGDVPEIAGLIAPRTCLWTVGSRDSLISPEWAERALERQGRIYKALAAGDQLTVDRFDGGHRWNGDLAYPALEKALG